MLALSLAVPGYADEASKQAKLVELMKTQGQYDLVEQMRADSIKRAKALRPQYEKQLRDSFPEAPADLWTHFDAAYSKFIDSSSKSWSTQDAIDLFAKLYGAQVGEDDLDQILAYYKSPIGQKDVQASRIAMPQWTAQLAERNQGAYKANLQVFLDDLRDYLKQCKAAVSAGSKSCEIPVPEGSKT